MYGLAILTVLLDICMVRVQAHPYRYAHMLEYETKNLQSGVVKHQTLPPLTLETRTEPSLRDIAIVGRSLGQPSQEKSLRRAFQHKRSQNATTGNIPPPPPSSEQTETDVDDISLINAPSSTEGPTNKDLEMHELDTVTTGPISVAGVDGCVALFLFGRGLPPSSTPFVTAMHLIHGDDHSGASPILQSDDIDAAIKQATDSGFVESISIASPLIEGDLDFVQGAINVKDSVQRSLLTPETMLKLSVKNNPIRTIPFGIHFYPWSEALDADVQAGTNTKIYSFVPSMRDFTIKAYATFEPFSASNLNADDEVSFNGLVNGDISLGPSRRAHMQL